MKQEFRHPKQRYEWVVSTDECPYCHMTLLEEVKTYLCQNCGEEINKIHTGRFYCDTCKIEIGIRRPVDLSQIENYGC